MSRRQVSVMAAFLLAAVLGKVHAGQPRFRINGKFIGSPVARNLKGYRIDTVFRGGVAWKAGLERGDIIVYIDTYGFRNEKAFDWIMGQVGQTAQVGIINVRTGRLEWLTCWFHHQPHRGEQRPPGVVNANFGFVGVVTIFNRTPNRLPYEIRYRQVGSNQWSQWWKKTHQFPNGGHQWITMPQVERVEIRFNRRGQWKVYNLNFQKHAGNATIDERSGSPYHFQFDGNDVDLFRGRG